MSRIPLLSLLGSFVTSVALAMFNTGCEDTAGNRAIKRHSEIDPVNCPPYNGSDTDLVDVIDLDPAHVVKDHETYFTFHYNSAELTNVFCLSLDFGKLCQCDVVSQTVKPSLSCSHDTSKYVTEFVFKKGSIIKEATADCPNRNP